jgi:glucosamine--fructose-6-phosphate aminotransferase (isomerizing)
LTVPAALVYTTSPVSIVRDEIREQPEVVDRLLAGQSGAIRDIVAAVEARRPRLVVTVARGSSDNAARYAEFVFGWMLRLPVASAKPSLHTLYGTPPSYEDALVLGISQSGASPDVVAVIAEATRQGCTTVAITNEPESPMAAAAGHVIDLGAGDERAVAATKTYTASLAAIAAMATAIAADGTRSRELERVPGWLAAQLDLTDRVADAVSLAIGWQHGAVMGRGANYCTAFETALKVKELTGVAAEPYSPADFLHGPVAVSGPDYPVVAVAPRGATRDLTAEVLGEVRHRGASVVVISDDETLPAAGEPLLPLVTTPEWLSPIVAVLPGQLLAVGLAEARGVDADHPFGLSKVTKTV